MPRPFSPKEYLEKLNQFLQDMETQPLVKKTFTQEEQIVDLFRFWYMDCREQEVIREAMEREKDDRWGLGDMLDGD